MGDNFAKSLVPLLIPIPTKDVGKKMFQLPQ